MENKEHFKRLVIYDFDGTLIDTQTPDKGKKIWKEVTGTDWPHKGWWSKKESLDMEVFDQDPILSVKNHYEKDVENDSNLLIMLTGRMPKLSNEVEKILDSNGFGFHRYLYNYGGSTLENKKEQIGKLLDEFQNIEYISMFEDRGEHVKEFINLMKDLVDSERIIGYDITHVQGEILFKHI